jgi:RNA polymerase sigma-32 factor
MAKTAYLFKKITKSMTEEILNSEASSLVVKKNDLGNSQNSGFLRYLRQIHKFPILTKEEELEHGNRYAETGDKESAQILVQSHLRLVAKMALRFKNYGLPIVDLVSEGNLGLMQAVKKFDPRKGFRFSTYAMWWIRAYMQDYILRSWSLVKIGTTAAQKKLFFNLHKIKKKLGSSNDGKALSVDHVQKISDNLGVTKKEVIDMNSRLSQSDTSLNNLVGDEDDSTEVVDLMASKDAGQEEIAIQNQEKLHRETAFKKAFETLNEREQDILTKRQMSENPLTLEDLSQIYKVSRERIRQIEENAIKKLRKEILKNQPN